MRERDTLALHVVHAHRRGVKQQVHHVVVKQVDLVDVQDAAVGGRQDARLEVFLAFLDGLLDVERADHAILRCADRQVNHGSLALYRHEGL